MAPDPTLNTPRDADRDIGGVRLPVVDQRAHFLELVSANPVNAAILERGPALGVPDWWLTAGAVFQTVWNVLDGRDPDAGIADYDFFYYDASDLSYEAEDAVIRRAGSLFADLGVTVEVRNEARVHRWSRLPSQPRKSSRSAES